MEPQPLELAFWQQACRHLDIAQSIDRMAEHVFAALPARTVLVRRLDAERGRLETVGQAGDALDLSLATRTTLDASALNAVRAWILEGRSALREALPESLARLLLPADLAGDAVLTALTDAGLAVGVLVLVGARDGRLDATHRALAERLAEPVTVALENDARLHELARLREAAEAENRALLSRLGRQSIVDQIVGEGRGLRTVLERVDQVARTEAPVLLLGETGSGKEVIARAIHQRSRRASGPIVRVNCGAIPTELVDSELFGHERGSFTGAVAQRKGWFERADGGTLFLDELGELPLAAQVRLLRVLQDGSLERVGGQSTLAVDVRIVAATHRDLAQRVTEGHFREDLWYRISVFPLRIPPLRERLADLPELAAHFAARAGERLGAGALEVSARDLELLAQYPWPGNVRELASVLERAAILGHGRELRVAQALGAGVEPRDRPASVAPRPALTSAPQTPSAPTLDAAMVRHIEDALFRASGRIEGRHGAAAALGINPHTLRARMRKLGIDWSRFRAGDPRRDSSQ